MRAKFACAAIAVAAGVANAQIWNEMGDAGQSLGTAQTPVGSGAIATIFGSLLGDADIYAIFIDSPAGFSAKTSGNSTTADTQLFLFDSSGMGITHNDDDPNAAGLQSAITGQFVPGPGLYYLAISNYNYDPESAGGVIWANSPFNVERQPDGPGAGSPLSSWSGTAFSDGGYEINLRGASFVPAPGALALLGFGGLAATRRRR